VNLVACLHRGLAVPAGTPAGISKTPGVAMPAVARGGSFREGAEAQGYEASWIGAADWLNAMRNAQAERARLWAMAPWLAPAGR
jgi:hypothetical protein